MTIRVLVVDDTPEIRSLLKDGLELLGKGYQITLASDGESALKMASECKPDIILMDIMMPGIDGLDSAIWIKNNPNLKNIPVIIMTAKSDDLSKGMSEVCADAFIRKPFRIREVDAIISAILKKKGE